MAQAVLERVLKDLDELAPAELQEVSQAVSVRLGERTHEEKRATFYNSLLNAGLISEIKVRAPRNEPDPPVIQVHGKPVSETIIEERR